MKRKKPTLGYFQFALLRPIIQPDEAIRENPAAVVLRAEATLRAGGWTPEQAKAETRRIGKRKTA